MKWFIFAAVALAAMIAVVAALGMLLPQAHVASRTARFKAAPETIWAVITGPQDWRPADNVKYAVVESVPPHRLVTRIADTGLPFGGSWTYSIAPQGGSSLLTITENGEVYNPIFRFVSRFIMGHTATIDAYIKALRAKLGEKG